MRVHSLNIYAIIIQRIRALCIWSMSQFYLYKSICQRDLLCVMTLRYNLQLSYLLVAQTLSASVVSTLEFVSSLGYPGFADVEATTLLYRLSTECSMPSTRVQQRPPPQSDPLIEPFTRTWRTFYVRWGHPHECADRWAQRLVFDQTDWLHRSYFLHALSSWPVGRVAVAIWPSFLICPQLQVQSRPSWTLVQFHSWAPRLEQ